MASKNRRLMVILMIVMALVLTSPALTRAQDDVNAPVAGNEELVPAAPEEQEAMVDGAPNEFGEATSEPAAVEAFNATRWYVQSQLGIGIDKNPLDNQLHIYGPGAAGSHIMAGHNRITMKGVNDPANYLPRLPYIEWRQADNTRAMYLGWGNSTPGARRVEMALENGYNLNIRGGRVGIETNAPQSLLDVRGTTTTKILQITGGSDLAEPFDIASTETVQPGMVVAIDPAHPGQLRITGSAYDRTVAGVVSGAGGIQPGLILEQEGSVVTGEHPVALTGRVYVWADASNGAIQPGDLLTTSDLPGHAMKVTEHELAQGAILGKAMTELQEGTGLVLLLVSLQ